MSDQHVTEYWENADGSIVRKDLIIDENDITYSSVVIGSYLDSNAIASTESAYNAYLDDLAAQPEA